MYVVNDQLDGSITIYQEECNMKQQKVIFCTHFTRDGVTYYAKDYGKKAFRFYVDPKSNKINYTI